MSIKKNLHFNSHMGRMGNQMFQYACAKELADHYGFTTSMSHLDRIDHFELGPSERLINRIKSFLFFRLSKPLFGMKILNTEMDCLKRLYIDDLQQVASPTMVWGFFQSPLYFTRSEAKIRKAFRVRQQFRTEFESFKKEHQLQDGGYFAIHLRRTDYKGFTVPGLEGNDFTLPMSYYHNAMAQMSKELGSMPVVFVSDDPECIDEFFPGMNNKIISRNDMVTDFLILRHAAKVIISNSTFAWWAAFLNDHKDVEVVCPKYFLGFKEQKEIPVNIYPENWKQVSI